MQLRKYQKKLIRGTIEALKTHRRVAMIAPTGSGKTVMATQICKAFQPVLWIAHQRELLTQARSALEAEKMPYLAGTPVNNRCGFNILSAASRNTPRFHHRLVVIDEFHHEACKTYRNLINELSFDRLLGITATRTRLDRHTLGFDKLVDYLRPEKLVELGFLAPVRLFRVRTPLPHAADLAVWANEHRNYIGRTIFFVKNLKEADQIKSMLTMPAEVISGKSDRESQIQAFRDGKIQVLIACLVLTEGVDLPMCRTAILGRMTQSKTMVSQMVGRVLRLHETKKHCNVVEPAALFGNSDHVSAESVMKPNEKYVSTPRVIGAVSFKTRRVG